APAGPPTGGQASAGRDPRSAGDSPATDSPAGGSPVVATGTDGRADAGASPSAQPSPPATPSTGQPGAGQSPHPPGLQPTTSARPGPGPVGAATADAPEAGAPGSAGSPGSTDAPRSAATGQNGADSADATTPEADRTLTGTGLTTTVGRDGIRHALDLSVAEPVTALQAEFRLAAGELAPGSGAAWTDLPGAVVTTQQERGTLVYRFTTPPGTDVKPGRYGFVVRGSRPAEPPGPIGPVLKPAPPEGWNAAAFGIEHPRAVAALGGFGPLSPQPAQQLAHQAH
ncbi:hypothetical protein ACFWIQ_31150, partial [Kitasatospora sp. NPDC127059]